MDDPTLEVYEADAEAICRRHRQVEPAGLRYLQAALAFFHPGAPTADLACGSGRDADHLRCQGFPTTGHDASPAMLREARAAYGDLDLQQACLPGLASIPDGRYANVLCAAALMHLPRSELITAALSLARVLRPGGRLVVTFRRARGGGEREPDGRLFTPIEPGRFLLLLESAGFRIVDHRQEPDPSRPEVVWQVVLAERSPLEAARGLDRIQRVLVQDRKTATYKPALIRALCATGRTHSHLVYWGDGEVYVPLWPLAVQWLAGYWPLMVEAPGFIAQIRGETPDSKKPVAFRRALLDLARRFGAGGLYAALRDIEENPQRHAALLGKIARTIRGGPVVYAGTGGPSVFRHQREAPGRDPSCIEHSLGWVVVPEPIWLDLCRFDHWIEDSVLVRWSRLTAEMNPHLEWQDVLPLLARPAGDERDTREVRQLLAGSPEPIECVWSGRGLRRFEIDHAIPYSIWGNNDLWNLLPCDPALNSRKGDRLPAHRLLRERDAALAACWRRYRACWGARFDRQIHRALGCDPQRPGWEDAALTGLEEAVERLAMTRGVGRWEVG